MTYRRSLRRRTEDRIYRRGGLLLRALVFAYGMVQYRDVVTGDYPGDTDPDLNDTYDRGRDLAHRITLRRYE